MLLALGSSHNPKRLQPPLPTPPPQPRRRPRPSTNTEQAVSLQGESGESQSTTKGGLEKGHSGDADSIPKEDTRIPASPTKRFLRTSAGVFTGILNRITGGVLGEFVCCFMVLWCPTLISCTLDTCADVQ